MLNEKKLTIKRIDQHRARESLNFGLLLIANRLRIFQQKLDAKGIVRDPRDSIH